MTHHPWRLLRERFADWTLVLTPLPAGMLGATDRSTKRIALDSRQLQAQRRCTLDHELLHAELGDVGPQTAAREYQIDVMSARRLISVEALLDALTWASSPVEAADELWVDLETFTVRMQNLTPPEVVAIQRIFRDRHDREGA